MPTDAMIEAAAIAIFTARPGGLDWDIQFDGVKDKFRRVARLALEAAERAAKTPETTRGLTAVEQKEQGRRCSCYGIDDYCPCQNAPDYVTRAKWKAETP